MKLLHLFAAALMAVGIGTTTEATAQTYSGNASPAVYTGGSLVTTDVQYRRDGRRYDNRRYNNRRYDNRRGYRRYGYNNRRYYGHRGYGRGCRTYYRYGRRHTICR